MQLQKKWVPKNIWSKYAPYDILNTAWQTRQRQPPLIVRTLIVRLNRIRVPGKQPAAPNTSEKIFI